MKIYITRGTLIGFLISVGILIGLGYTSFLYFNKLLTLSKWSAHARLVLFDAEQIRTHSMEVHSIQLRYVISGDDLDLKRLRQASDDLRNQITDLDSLTADNPSQQERLKQLRETAEQRISFTLKVVKAREKSFEEARDLMQTMRGDELQNQLRQEINNIQSEENSLIQKRSTGAGKQFRQFSYAFIGLLIVTLAILLVLFYSINQNFKVRQEVEAKLKKARGAAEDLYQNAPCGYFSFDKNGTISEINRTLLSWIGYQYDHVVGRLRVTDIFTFAGEIFYREGQHSFITASAISNIEATTKLNNKENTTVIMNASTILNEKGIYLGGRCTVFDSTDIKKAEAEALRSNKELEAFSYSVSHDLRAPLRSIAGYTQILKEEHSGQLDSEGLRVTNVILTNAIRMGHLIDDLLSFSKTSRQEMNKVVFRMDDLVKTILDELLEGKTTRVMHLDVLELGTAFGDNTMLRQVWINLLSNAIKYTEKKAEAFIKVGAYEKDGDIIYYVKDNGVGFDMKYYGKLFGVFQRLHKANEFEGTGVGLALVKRIIDRHQGKIWGEAVAGEGATFYFSLPKTT